MIWSDLIWFDYLSKWREMLGVKNFNIISCGIYSTRSNSKFLLFFFLKSCFKWKTLCILKLYLNIFFIFFMDYVTTHRKSQFGNWWTFFFTILKDTRRSSHCDVMGYGCDIALSAAQVTDAAQIWSLAWELFALILEAF